MKKIVWLMSLVMVAWITGCQRKETITSKESFIYVMDYEEDNIIKQAYQLEVGDANIQVRDMLRQLKKQPEDPSYKALISNGVEVRDYNLTDGKLRIDFNIAYHELSASQEVLVRAGIVQSLLQIEGLDSVLFSAGNQEVKNKSGSVIGWMCEDSFVMNAGASLNSYQKAELVLYFADTDGKNLKRVERTVRYNSNISKERLALDELIKGPQDSSLKQTLNVATKVNSVSLKDGVCYVNLDHSFWQLQPPRGAQLAIYSIVNSIIESGGATRVEILKDGESTELYQNEINVNGPLERNLDIVKGES